MARPTICAGCGAPLPPPTPGPGRPRRWCSERCRHAAYRRRHAVVVDWTAEPAPPLTPWTPPGSPPPVQACLPPAAPPEEQLVVAVLEAYAIAGSLRRLSREVERPQLRYRSERLFTILADALEDLFPAK